MEMHLDLEILVGLVFLVACALILAASGLAGLTKPRRPSSNEIVDRVKQQKQSTGMLVDRRRGRDEALNLRRRETDHS
jgi:hypothetical protein